MKIVGVGDRLERMPKKAWFNELQEINKSIQTENAKLKKMLQDAKEENQRLRFQLQAMKEQVGEGSMIEATINPSCDHGKYTSYRSNHDNVDGCAYFQMIEDALQTPGNQGGFLEASSTSPSHQEEHLSTFREDDQVSQTGMEVNDSPCLVPSFNVDTSFGVF
jgi:regulator of replication initiation timing